MKAEPSPWEERLARLWQSFDSCEPTAFNAAIGQLAAERPADDAIATFERACAQDSTGHPELAVPLYQRALAAGLTGLRPRRAPGVIIGFHPADAKCPGGAGGTAAP